MSFTQSSTLNYHTKTHGNKKRENTIAQKLKSKDTHGIEEVEMEECISDENNMNEKNENSEFFTCDGCKNNFDNITFETHIEKCTEFARLMESSNGTEDDFTTEIIMENSSKFVNLDDIYLKTN